MFGLQVKEAEKQAMIEGIRENGSEAAEFVIRKVRTWRNRVLLIVDDTGHFVRGFLKRESLLFREQFSWCRQQRPVFPIKRQPIYQRLTLSI